MPWQVRWTDWSCPLPSALSIPLTVVSFFLTCLYDSLKFLLNLCPDHSDNGWSAMGTVIRILKGQKLIDQLIGLRRGQTVVSLHGCLAGHGGHASREDFRRNLSVPFQFIQHLHK